MVTWSIILLVGTVSLVAFLIRLMSVQEAISRAIWLGKYDNAPPKKVGKDIDRAMIHFWRPVSDFIPR
jgi:hypothetical protein